MRGTGRAQSVCKAVTWQGQWVSHIMSTYHMDTPRTSLNRLCLPPHTPHKHYHCWQYVCKHHIKQYLTESHMAQYEHIYNTLSVSLKNMLLWKHRLMAPPSLLLGGLWTWCWLLLFQYYAVLWRLSTVVLYTSCRFAKKGVPHMQQKLLQGDGCVSAQ